MSEQQSVNRTSGTSFVERLAHELGVTVNAAHIYAAPVERDGVTVIPVAKAIYGLGGGGGTTDKEQGHGGGGGVALVPVGYIEIRNGETRFRPTRDPFALVPKILAAAAPLLLLTVWGISKLPRGNGKK
jgi:uncharacterized spore protein YtfJ